MDLLDYLEFDIVKIFDIFSGTLNPQSPTFRQGNLKNAISCIKIREYWYQGSLKVMHIEELLFFY